MTQKIEWTEELVEKRFEECADTLRKLPSNTHLGYSNCWPEIKLTEREIARHETKKLILRPTPAQITRMEETLGWFHWINPGERNLVWLRAYRYSWRNISRQTGFPPTSAKRYYRNALAKICSYLYSSEAV